MNFVVCSVKRLPLHQPGHYIYRHARLGWLYLSETCFKISPDNNNERGAVSRAITVPMIWPVLLDWKRTRNQL